MHTMKSLLFTALLVLATPTVAADAVDAFATPVNHDGKEEGAIHGHGGCTPACLAIDTCDYGACTRVVDINEDTWDVDGLIVTVLPGFEVPESDERDDDCLGCFAVDRTQCVRNTGLCVRVQLVTALP